MTKFSITTARTVLAAAALIATPAIAHAEAFSTTVSYADLNLSTPQGQATLKSRIAMAVTKVCGANDAMLDLAQRVEISKCRAKASHDAYASAKIKQAVYASR